MRCVRGIYRDMYPDRVIRAENGHGYSKYVFLNFQVSDGWLNGFRRRDNTGFREQTQQAYVISEEHLLNITN